MSKPPQQDEPEPEAAEAADLPNRAARRAQRHGKKLSQSPPLEPAPKTGPRNQIAGGPRRAGRRGNR